MSKIQHFPAIFFLEHNTLSPFSLFYRNHVDLGNLHYVLLIPGCFHCFSDQWQNLYPFECNISAWNISKRSDGMWSFIIRLRRRIPNICLAILETVRYCYWRTLQLQNRKWNWTDFSKILCVNTTHQKRGLKLQKKLNRKSDSTSREVKQNNWKNSTLLNLPLSLNILNGKCKSWIYWYLFSISVVLSSPFPSTLFFFSNILLPILFLPTYQFTMESNLFNFYCAILLIY